MKLLVSACLLFCNLISLRAQYNDYTAIDNKVMQIPKTSTYATASIVQFVQENFSADKDKVRAIYAWVTANIHYNKDSMFHRYWGDDPEIKLGAILRSRKGVCEDYALLFTSLVGKCAIPSFVVSGYAKTGRAINRSGHSWSAVYVDKQWLLCDPTWDEGVADDHYFLIDPAQFIQTHFPFDPLWQLQEHPVTHKEYQQGYTSSRKDTATFHFIDSANAFMQMDTLQQQESASRRMLRYGLEDDNLQTWYAYNQMKIAIVYQESDMTVFNSAVADLNKAKSLYNDFVGYRNNRFTPARPDETMAATFTIIDSLLTSSQSKAINIGKKTENYQYDTDSLQENIAALTKKSEVQKEFLKRYLALNPADREKQFYR